MSELFAAYTPRAWFDEAGLMSRARAGFETQAKTEKRSKNWTKSVAMSIVAAVVGSILFTVEASASTLSSMPVPGGVVPRAGSLGSVGETNESFQTLFNAFRQGAKLLPDGNVRQLAVAAAARRHQKPQDIESWARKLASDIKDADD